MAKQATDTRRKLVEFDAKTWHALNLLSRESMKTFQELADEAFRDLLHKYGRPTDLKAALRESARPSARAAAMACRRVGMGPARRGELVETPRLRGFDIRSP